MIYLFYGSDTAKVRAKAFEWVTKARTKEPNLSYVRLAREEVTASSLEAVSASGGLFVQRLLALIDDPFEGAGASIVEPHLAALAASDNAIIILAPELAPAMRTKIERTAKAVYVFDKKAVRTHERGFNSALVNALGARQREKLWLELERSLAAGDAPEMLHGLLHWKARDVLEKGSRAWTPPEARQLSLDLIALLQESRRGGLELPLALERFSLSV